MFSQPIPTSSYQAQTNMIFFSLARGCRALVHICTGTRLCVSVLYVHACVLYVPLVNIECSLKSSAGTLDI